SRAPLIRLQPLSGRPPQQKALLSKELLSGGSGAGAQGAADAGQAATGAQVELPAVQLAGEGLALDHPEPGQVGLEVRAPTLHQPAVQLDVLRLDRFLVLVVPALGVLQALLREALEERVDELVVLP